MSESDHEDETLQLSSDTMKALLEFYNEQDEREEKLREIEDGKIPETFEENWNMSQFWYDDDTSEALARECIEAVGNGGSIACLSCPTLYLTLRKKEHNCEGKYIF